MGTKTATKTSDKGLQSAEMVLVNRSRGLTVIPESTPLTRLNYYDGKFLRAQDLSAEQTYLRKLVQLSNRANGHGVAHGFSVRLGGGGTLRVSAGLAITPEGHVLLLPSEAVLGIEKLLELSRLQTKSFTAASAGSGEFGDCVEDAAAPPDDVLRSGDLYLITIAPAEALCGLEDVFGKLCEEACVTSKDRPYRVEGVVFRATPLLLRTPRPTSVVVELTAKHLRSCVASSYYADERRRVASLISGSGLQSELWCLGAEGVSGIEVPIGVLSRSGGTTTFLDAWIARREMIDSPARSYWQWRMAMRPWDVFLAQVLQFQCQLRDALGDGGGAAEDDPCVRNSKLVADAALRMAEVAQFYEEATSRMARMVLGADERPLAIAGGLTGIADLQKKLALAGDAFLPGNRILIDRGIVELPSAGYLPVVPGAAVTANLQVRRLMGEGVNLRFCVVRPDYVAHALEEAQHMDRISLLTGLDDPDRKPDVDILVPDGEILSQKTPSGSAFRASVQFGNTSEASRLKRDPWELTGAGQVEASETGPVRLHVAADATPTGNLLFAAELGQVGASMWVSGTCRDNPFAPGASGVSSVELRFVLVARGKETLGTTNILVNGTFRYEPPVRVGSTRRLKGTLSGSFSMENTGSEPLGGTITMLVEARLFDGSNDQPPQLRLVLKVPQFKETLALDFDWKGTPLQIGVTVRDPDSGHIELIEDPDVMDENDKNHARALAALERIADALSEPNFYQQALADLFPPPLKPAEELAVQATLDWVLFHRRRAKQCELEVAKPETAPPRIYQIYHLLWNQKLISVDRIVEALHANETDVLKRLGFRELAMVEFAPLSPNLLSLPASVLQDWEAGAPGGVLLYGGIASEEAAANEGTPLATGRLKSLVKTVEPASKLVQGGRLEALPGVPAALPAGPDGLIAMITREVETVCNSIHIIKSPEVLKSALQMIEQKRVKELLSSSPSIQRVNFEKDTGIAVESSFAGLLDQWKLQTGGAFVGTIVEVVRNGDTTNSDAALRAQGSAIARRIQAGNSVGPMIVLSPVELPVSCPAMTLLVPAAPDRSVSPDRSGDFQFRAAATPKRVRAERQQAIGDVVLTAVGTDPDPDSKVDVLIFISVPFDHPPSQPPKLVIGDPAPEDERPGENVFFAKPVPGSTGARRFEDVPLRFSGSGARAFRFTNLSANTARLGADSGISEVMLGISVTRPGQAFGVTVENGSLVVGQLGD